MLRPFQAFSRSICATTVVSVGVIALCAGGCRSSARNDVYIDKLAAEVRYLEDQLYQVDYENKVLREKLLRAREAELRQPPEPSKGLFGNLGKTNKSSGSSKTGSNEPGLGRIQTPDTQLGQPTKKPAGGSGSRGATTPEIQLPDMELPDIQSGDVSPPSDDQLVPPLIDPGELVPPGGSSQMSVPRQGQVVLPASVQHPVAAAVELMPPPASPPPAPADPTIDSLVIDADFSRALIDDKADCAVGVHLVVKGLNKDGREVPIDLPLKFAVLDPIRDGIEARLGIWQYDVAQLSELHSTDGTDGLHIPILWHDRQPFGESVQVYCRLERPDGHLVDTNTTIDLSTKSGRVEAWTPRAAMQLPTE